MSDTRTQREQIAAHFANTIAKEPEVKTVMRRLASYEELNNLALTQFPVVSLVTGLPVPTEKLSSRVQGKIDKTISTLTIGAYVYLQDAEEVDTNISFLAGALKKLILDEETQGGLVLDTRITFDSDVGYLSPFVAFKINIITRYIHNTGGI